MLRQLMKTNDVVTLLFSARNENENQAVVLRDYVE